jgi:hypothetical protein
MASTEDRHEGSCLCGRVRYRITGPFGPLSNCHCTDCRKSHGAVFATYADVPSQYFELLQGKENLMTYRAESGTKRSFCRTCGSNITCFVDHDPQVTEVAVATLDTPLLKRPEYHIFVRSKVPWFDIQDGTPQHQAYPEKK